MQEPQGSVTACMFLYILAFSIVENTFTRKIVFLFSVPLRIKKKKKLTLHIAASKVESKLLPLTHMRHFQCTLSIHLQELEAFMPTETRAPCVKGC